MTRHYYSPHTLELIATTTPADWMASTDVAPPAFQPETQSCLFQDGAWVVADVVPPGPAVPEAVTRFQARAALAQAGLLDGVNGMMEHPDTPVIAKLAWADALEFRRHSPTVLALAGALGMSAQQLDELFVAAAGIEA